MISPSSLDSSSQSNSGIILRNESFYQISFSKVRTVATSLLRVPKIFRFINDNGKRHRIVRGEEAFLTGLARLSSQHLPVLFRILSL